MKYLQKYQVGVIFFSIILICSSVFAAGSRSDFDSKQGLIRGQAALEELGDRLPDVAVKNRMSAKQLEELLLRDHDIAVTADDKLLYTCHFNLDPAAGAEPGSPISTGSIAPYNQTFLLHSQPGADHTLYLDFDGEYVVDPAWNNGDPVDALAYDMDGDPNSFSDAELDNIQQIWARVAEDYIIFDNFNVTTEDPGIEALIKTDEFDDVHGIRIVITATNMGSSAGGISYYHSFSWPTGTVAWAFTTGVGVGAKNLGEVCSHEVGHTLSLYHDGTVGGVCGRPVEYYAGHDDWAPIMGVSYSKAVTQWDKGEYTCANNQGDDIAMMQTSGGFGYRTDDCGDSIGTATALGSLPVIENYGIIETSTDVDVFSFTLTQEIDVTVNAWSDWPQGNLDLELKLLRSDESVVGQSNDSALGCEVVTSTLAAGTYYISIEGVAGTGYSDYDSMGQYYITVLDYIVPLITPVGVTAISEAYPATRTIDGSGLTGDGSAGSTVGTDAFSQEWWTLANPVDPWITFDLGEEYDVTVMRVWNTNWDPANYSTTSADVYTSVNGVDFTYQEGVTFAQAPGNGTYTGEDFDVDYSGVRYIKFDITGFYGQEYTYACLSEVRFEGTVAGGSPDTDPPTPNPATFASAPSADSSSAISMTATTGTDATDPVYYYFDETSGENGGTDSGWQTSPDYTDSGLDPDTQYTYTVQMRDSAGTPNVGTASAPANATTDGCTPTDMHIEAVACSEVSCGGPNRNGRSTVTIYDDCGNPVANALVDGTFSGAFSETIYDVATDANGQAVLTTSGCVKLPSFSFTVDAVTHGTLPHDSNDDLATGCSG